MKPRTRSWMREEVILALDLYLREGRSDREARARLSTDLRAIPVERDSADDPRFRGPRSVENKLYNIEWLDTDGTAGRANGGGMTRTVWAEFGRDGDRTAAAAAEIRRRFGLSAG